jgi:error-prone DNA polymerase
MSRLRPQLNNRLCTSKDIIELRDNAEVITAGLVIRRQRPLGKTVFITLEDEFGHIPLIIFPQVYNRNEHKFKSSFLIISGKLTRREGTLNVVVDKVKPFSALDKIPQSKDWR